MRWEGQRRSENVEDRRGSRVGMAAGGGIGVVIIGLLIALLTGQDPGQIVSQLPQGGGTTSEQGPLQTTPEEEKQKEMIEVVLAWTEDIWTEQFKRAGRTYEKPTLVFFRQAVSSACGIASAAVGPFYCPADQKVYIDLSFFDELDKRFKAPGDFAQAYVIAHEVGHHVQNLLGISEKVQRLERRARQQGRGQPGQRAARAAGRLLRRRLGPPRAEAAQVPGAGRPRGGDPRRRGHRRRRDPEAGPGLRRARLLHPRHRAASASPGSATGSPPATSARATPSTRRSGAGSTRAE